MHEGTRSSNNKNLPLFSTPEGEKWSPPPPPPPPHTHTQFTENRIKRQEYSNYTQNVLSLKTEFI